MDEAYWAELKEREDSLVDDLLWFYDRGGAAILALERAMRRARDQRYLLDLQKVAQQSKAAQG